MAEDNIGLEEDLLPLPPPKKKQSQNTTTDTGDFLPKPPIKKYTPLYFWHKIINWFR